MATPTRAHRSAAIEALRPREDFPWRQWICGEAVPTRELKQPFRSIQEEWERVAQAICNAEERGATLVLKAHEGTWKNNTGCAR